MIIGQNKAKAQIDILTHHQSNKPILLVGPSGYGKTSLAKYIAKDKHLSTLNCAFIKNDQEFIRALLSAPPYSFLFLDEIHALTRNMQEILYTVIDDSVILDKGRRISCNNFQIIGATTKDGSLNEPLYNRFVFKIRLDKYSIEELSIIVQNYLSNLGIYAPFEVCNEVAFISRNNPRVAKSRAEWILALCIKNGSKNFTAEDIKELKIALDIDNNGLEKIDRDYLDILRRARAPVSLKTISQILRTDEETIQNNIESFLLDKNLIGRGPRGRYLVE